LKLNILVNQRANLLALARAIAAFLAARTAQTTSISVRRESQSVLNCRHHVAWLRLTASSKTNQHSTIPSYNNHIHTSHTAMNLENEVSPIESGTIM